MHFTEDQLVQILLAALAILGYLAKRWADARLVKVGKEAEANVRRAEAAEAAAKAHAKQMEIEAEIRKAQADEAAKLIDIIGKSLDKAADAMKESTEQFMQKLDAKQEEVEEKQLTLNEHLLRTELLENQIVAGLAKLEQATTETLAGMSNMQSETRSIVHWELAEAVDKSQRQAGQRDVLKFIMGGKAIPFPPEHGYAYRKCTLKVRSEKGVNLFPAPLHTDQKPTGRIFNGDEVWIMWDVPFPEGWAAVNAYALGIKGWVYKEFIGIEDCKNEAVLTPT